MGVRHHQGAGGGVAGKQVRRLSGLDRESSCGGVHRATRRSTPACPLLLHLLFATHTCAGCMTCGPSTGCPSLAGRTWR